MCYRGCCLCVCVWGASGLELQMRADQAGKGKSFAVSQQKFISESRCIAVGRKSPGVLLHLNLLP